MLMLRRLMAGLLRSLCDLAGRRPTARDQATAAASRAGPVLGHANDRHGVFAAMQSLPAAPLTIRSLAAEPRSLPLG